MRLHKQRAHLFVFLDHREVDATNNLAERQLRPAVIARKLSAGNKTRAGADAWAILTSLGATARQQALSFSPSSTCSPAASLGGDDEDAGGRIAAGEVGLEGGDVVAAAVDDEADAAEAGADGLTDKHIVLPDAAGEDEQYRCR